jgi:hypothetical protein
MPGEDPRLRCLVDKKQLSSATSIDAEDHITLFDTFQLPQSRRLHRNPLRQYRSKYDSILPRARHRINHNVIPIETELQDSEIKLAKRPQSFGSRWARKSSA